MGPVQFRWPHGVAENSFTKLGFGENFVDFPRKKSKTQSSLNFLRSGPRKFTKSDFWIGPDPVSSELRPPQTLYLLGKGETQTMVWVSGVFGVGVDEGGSQ